MVSFVVQTLRARSAPVRPRAWRKARMTSPGVRWGDFAIVRRVGRMQSEIGSDLRSVGDDWGAAIDGDQDAFDETPNRAGADDDLRSLLGLREFEMIAICGNVERNPNRVGQKEAGLGVVHSAD